MKLKLLISVCASVALAVFAGYVIRQWPEQAYDIHVPLGPVTGRLKGEGANWMFNAATFSNSVYIIEWRMSAATKEDRAWLINFLGTDASNQIHRRH